MCISDEIAQVHRRRLACAVFGLWEKLMNYDNSQNDISAKSEIL